MLEPDQAAPKASRSTQSRTANKIEKLSLPRQFPPQSKADSDIHRHKALGPNQQTPQGISKREHSSDGNSMECHCLLPASKRYKTSNGDLDLKPDEILETDPESTAVLWKLVAMSKVGVFGTSVTPSEQCLKNGKTSALDHVGKFYMFDICSLYEVIADTELLLSHPHLPLDRTPRLQQKRPDAFLRAVRISMRRYYFLVRSLSSRSCL